MTTLRVSQGDVVRVRDTKEVGTVVGWTTCSGPDRVTSNVVTVRISLSDTRSYPPGKLAFVASAATKLRGVRLANWWLTWLLTGAWSGWSAYDVYVTKHVSLALAVFIGLSLWSTLHQLAKHLLVEPRKTKLK